MIVAGGTYVEECIAPPSTALLGSGGRAALALGGLESVKLHTFYPNPDEIRVNFGPSATAHPSDETITFRYLHPLARPQIDPQPCIRAHAVRLIGKKVLRFGCIEGEFIVEAGDAVYDPQGSGSMFRANGSSAQRLAVILNEHEAQLLGGAVELATAASKVMASEGAEIVIVKCGPAGAIVLRRGLRTTHFVPAFRTTAINKIGSGDVFSAMFSYYWCTRRLDAIVAAELASRQVADYVQTGVLTRPAMPPKMEKVECDPRRLHVLLAADVDTTPALWLAEEARAALISLGVLEVTVPAAYELPVSAAMLAACDAVLVLPRTGKGLAALTAAAAVAAGKPCVAFAETVDTSKALTQAGALVINDFTASIYSVIWSTK